MFNRRRSQIQIIGDILDLSRDGAKKTEILYQNNMSFTQLQEYLAFLLEKGFIEEGMMTSGNGGQNKIFVTTERGNALLDDIQRLMEYFK